MYAACGYVVSWGLSGAAVQSADDLPARTSGMLALRSFAVLAALSCVLAVTQPPGDNQQRERQVQAELAELATIVSNHRGQSIGVGSGGDKSYFGTAFRAELPATNGLVLAPGAIMDMQQGGLELPSATLDAMASGATAIWLIPKGDEPFSMKSWYSDQDLFGPELRRVFHEHYEKAETTEHFDVWIHRR